MERRGAELTIQMDDFLKAMAILDADQAEPECMIDTLSCGHAVMVRLDRSEEPQIIDEEAPRPAEPCCYAALKEKWGSH